MSTAATETIGIIPCSATKIDRPAAARDLYASTYFQGALAAAEAQCDRVFILSALHGLISPDAIVAPYDLKMGDPGSITADEIAAQADALDLEAADIYAFMGATYFSILDEGLRQNDIFASPVYEATRGIGDHKGICRRAAA